MPEIEVADGKIETAHDWLASDWLAGEWLAALESALAAAGGEGAAPRLGMRPAEPAGWTLWEAPFWLQLALDTVPSGSILAGGPEASVRALGRWLAGEAALPEERRRETFRELMNGAAATLAGRISERLRRNVQFGPAQPARSPARPAHAVEIELALPEATCTLGFAPSAELAAALEEQREDEAGGVPAERGAAGVAGANLDLLMEVALPVCVSFGRTQLPLKDVLKLSSGSIVELNRLVNEPVEVLINDSVIARGEVVVIEGNYGIRVTEIVSRQERIRSIF